MRREIVFDCDKPAKVRGLTDHCPNCGQFVFNDYKLCPLCGQLLDWTLPEYETIASWLMRKFHGKSLDEILYDPVDPSFAEKHGMMEISKCRG